MLNRKRGEIMLVALCEDNVSHLHSIQKIVDDWVRANGRDDVFVYAYMDTRDLLQEWEGGRRFDLLFLDIEFTAMSGIGLAEAIRGGSKEAVIVFISHSSMHAVQSIEENPYRYIVKPVEAHIPEIAHCLEYAYDQCAYMTENAFAVQVGKAMLRIRYSDILYIQSNEHWAHLFTVSSGKQLSYLENGFDAFTKPLPRKFFVRCHRRFLINLQHVRKLTREGLVLSDGTEIPVSRSYQDEIRAKFIELNARV
jgi:DNA-binding LytR/AlgR family response regulator